MKTLGIATIIMVSLASLGVPRAEAQNLPPGMIFFVATEQCPIGSSPALDAAGRILIATKDPLQVGLTQGTPMVDLEDNTHTHVASMTVNLPEHHIAGASSCCNGQATTKGNHAASFTSGPATTGLPFIQLLVCVAH